MNDTKQIQGVQLVAQFITWKEEGKQRIRCVCINQSGIGEVIDSEPFEPTDQKERLTEEVEKVLSTFSLKVAKLLGGI